LDFLQSIAKAGNGWYRKNGGNAVNKITKQHQNFESIRHEDAEGNEFWQARELAAVLGYAEYRNFFPVILKAREACENSGHSAGNHFVRMHEMVVIGSGAKRLVEDVRLSRYACYLLVQNGDPSKPVIALGQTYFAIQTRKQELQAEFPELSVDDRRLAIRRELVEHNKALVSAAKKAGVETGRICRISRSWV
jgi:DNA-damage-inducible protein D